MNNIINAIDSAIGGLVDLRNEFINKPKTEPITETIDKKAQEHRNRSQAQKKAIARDYRTVSSLSVKGFYQSQRGSWSRLDNDVSQAHVGKPFVYKIEARQGIVKTYNLNLGFTGTVRRNGTITDCFLKGKKSTPIMLEKFWEVNKEKLQSLGLV